MIGVTNNVKSSGPADTIIHIDIDPASIQKKKKRSYLVTFHRAGDTITLVICQK
jgi:thiamine pyrophosphate-dependent acetolactate synthase large subunit-like protein